MYVIMICMVIVFSTMILLTYGTINESSFAMGFSMFLLVVALLLEFIGAIVILVYGVEESDILIKDLKEVFFKLIYRMDYDERANRILKIVQEYVRSFMIHYYLSMIYHALIHGVKILSGEFFLSSEKYLVKTLENYTVVNFTEFFPKN